MNKYWLFIVWLNKTIGLIKTNFLCVIVYHELLYKRVGVGSGRRFVKKYEQYYFKKNWHAPSFVCNKSNFWYRSCIILIFTFVCSNYCDNVESAAFLYYCNWFNYEHMHSYILCSCLCVLNNGKNLVSLINLPKTTERTQSNSTLFYH